MVHGILGGDVFHQFGTYACDACITVNLHESDKRNALLGPLLIYY
jgi:hypothetical protein